MKSGIGTCCASLSQYILSGSWDARGRPERGTLMASEWLYQRNGEVFGPVSGQELSAAAHLGFLRPEDLVRRCDRTTWKQAKRLKGLFVVVRAPSDETKQP